MAVIIRCQGLISNIGSHPAFINQWYLPSTVGGSNTDATNCLAHFKTIWVALAPKIVSVGVISYDTSVIAMEATTGVLTGSWSASPVTGTTCTGGSAMLPAQTQGLISWNTAQVFNGRRLRGRTYVPAPDEADNSGTIGAPGASYIVQLNAAIAAMNTAVTGGSLPVVWHRPTPGGSNGGHGAITGGTARPYWSVQVKRR